MLWMTSGSCLDCINDSLIAGAATQVASKRFTYLRTSGVRTPLKQSLCGHQHPGCTETTLHRPILNERLLEGMKVLCVSQAANCRDRGSINLNGQDETG